MSLYLKRTTILKKEVTRPPQIMWGLYCVPPPSVHQHQTLVLYLSTKLNCFSVQVGGMTISSKTPGKKINPGRKAKIGVQRVITIQQINRYYNSFIHPLYFPVISEGLFILLYRCQASDRGNLSTSDGTKKSGVDPPPSPTTPASYRQLFCSIKTSLSLW